jgi:hypothetical protein
LLVLQMVLMVADVEEKLSEGDLSTVDLLAMATVPGNYSDVVEKAFSFDVRWRFVVRFWKLLEMCGGAFALT